MRCAEYYGASQNAIGFSIERTARLMLAEYDLGIYTVNHYRCYTIACFAKLAKKVDFFLLKLHKCKYR